MPTVKTVAPIQVSPPAVNDPTLPDALTAPIAQVERYMESYVRSAGLSPNLEAAVLYALVGGGKRLRPMLVMHCGAAVGGTVESCLPAAAAVEMIHAFSLVHDDLPALDNDDLRRGRPTTHKAHGEAMAILAGDGLMSLAFQVLADRCPPAMAGALCLELAHGNTNMILGQVLDTLGGFEPTTPPAQRLERVHRNKTGALIRASCRMGAIAAMRTEQSAAKLDAITRYGEAIGLMFQIVDDLLDVEQTAEHTGKRTAKDQDAGKLTYPGVLGVEPSRAEIERLAAAAHNAVAPLGAAAMPLRDLCEYMAIRTR